MKLSCVLKTAGMMILFFIVFGTVFGITAFTCIYLALLISDMYSVPNPIMFGLGLLLTIIAMSFEFAIGMCYIDGKKKKEQPKEQENPP